MAVSQDAAAVAATSVPPPHQASLYVGDLGPEVTETQLFEVFKEAGQVLSIRVCRDHVSRRSLGYGYVNFQSPADAERALETLNFHRMKNSNPIRLMWSQRDPSLRRSGNGNVFIKNLHADIDNQMLNDTFSQFGNILSCKVATGSNGESLGYGFVHFEKDEDALQAITKVDGKLLLEQAVVVTSFQRRATRIAQSQEKFTNCFIKGLKAGITEAEVTTYMTKFGEVTSVKVATDRRDRTFGFCDFKNHESAQKACEEVKGNVPELGESVEVARHQKKGERAEQLRKIHQQFKTKRFNENAGQNLYVKNLDDTVDDEQLKTAFAKFGEVNSARVMKDDSGASKGFGFVCYADSENATKAMAEMNGFTQLGSKPLYVNIAQRKEVRRATLEIQYATRMGRGMAPGGMAPGQNVPSFVGSVGAFGQPQAGYGGFGSQPFYGLAGGAGRGMPPKWGQPTPGYPHGAPGRGPPVPGRGGPQVGGRGGIPRGPGFPGRGQPGRGRGGPGGVRVLPGSRNVPTNPVRAGEPLTPQMLAGMTAEQQKNTMGDRLFVRINETHPEHAAKITGMLLEMDITEQLNLLEAPDVLNSKISEAMEVLKSHSE